MPRNAAEHQQILDVELDSEYDLPHKKMDVAKATFSLILGAVFLVLGVFLLWENSRALLEVNVTFLSNLGLYMAFLFVLISIAMFVSPALAFLSAYFSGLPQFKDEFSLAFVVKNASLVNAFTTSVLFFLVVSIFVAACGDGSGEEKVFPGHDVGATDLNVIKKMLTTKVPHGIQFLLSVKSMLETVLVVLLLVLVARGVMQFIAWKMYFSSFRDKIMQNNRKVLILKALNEVSQIKMDESINTWAYEVFKVLARGKGDACLEDFAELFHEDAKEVFEMFDVDHDENISEEEFVQIYLGIVNEKKHMRNALCARNDSLRKVNLALYAGTVVLSIFAAGWIWGKAANVVTIVAGMAPLLVAAQFMFGSAVAEALESMVFALMVRPFDAGDVILLENKTYTVMDFGLLYTTLYIEGKCVNVPNAAIRRSFVTNLMRSNYRYETYELKLDYESCKDKIDLLRKKIAEFLLVNKKIFNQDFDIFDMRFEGTDVFVMKIAVRIEVFYPSVKVANMRKDIFTLFLHDATKELEFVYK